MAKTIKLCAILLLFAVSCSSGMEWKNEAIDGSLTGVRASSASDVDEKMGKWSDGVYKAPNGKLFTEGSTPEVARLMLEVQPQIADLKQKIGYASMDMISERPESPLSNWFIDTMMQAAEEASGKPVDFGITNFGGIRIDLFKGDILKDDIVSMFPFKNHLCYLELKGSSVRELLEQLAATTWQVVGGVRCEVKDKKLVSAQIGGEPIDDEKVYGVCTISFLLNGGDGISVAKNALKLIEYKNIMVIDFMLPAVESLTAEGKDLEYYTDGRIKYLD